MVEPRPESLGGDVVRALVADALAAPSAATDHDGATVSPRRAVAWPEGRLDLQAPPVARAEPFATNPARVYALGDFSRFHDRDFVAAAYRGLLERRPDPDGLDHYLTMLRAGMAKTEILGRLRYSDEGRRVGAHVASLRVRYPIAVVMRQPVVGNLLGLLDVLLRANALKRGIRQLEAHVALQAESQAAAIERVDGVARRNDSILEGRVNVLRDR